MQNKIYELYALEQLADGDTFIHKIHPAVKLFVTVFFIIMVVSFDRYMLARLVPYVFYPTLLMALSETPYKALFKRFLLALPFCLFAGISNLIFDRNIAFNAYNLTVSYGAISFFTIILKTYLCVMVVLLLVSTTPFVQLTAELRRFKVPSIFVLMFEMTYRYIGVLIDEAYSMYTAYFLRSTNTGGIAMKDMGSFVGQLLLRSFERAERIYESMKCRGYANAMIAQNKRNLTQKDILFLLITCFLFIVFRVININTVFNKLFGDFF